MENKYYNQAQKRIEALVLKAQRTEVKLDKLEKKNTIYGSLTYMNGKVDYSNDILTTFVNDAGIPSTMVVDEEGWIDTVPYYNSNMLEFCIELKSFQEILLPSLKILVIGKTTQPNEADMITASEYDYIYTPLFYHAFIYMEDTQKYYLKLWTSGYFYWDYLAPYYIKIIIKLIRDRGIYGIQPKTS